MIISHTGNVDNDNDPDFISLVEQSLVWVHHICTPSWGEISSGSIKTYSIVTVKLHFLITSKGSFTPAIY